ncbi:MAG: GldG family protein [Planctomycetia bacterium]|nr:GldG family protein [Planctomycetia bacterium]
MKSILRTVGVVVCIIVIAVCAIMIIQKIVGRARLDLTEHRIYTLSQGTRNIIAKLNQPIKLKLYYSRTAAAKGPEQIRYFNNYFLYVRDLLEEYVGLSRGRLTLSVIDPRGFSDEEEDAINSGINHFPMSGENFFFGLLAQSELGKKKVIPFFEPDRQEFVEYDISKLISSVIRRDKKKLGVISSLPVTGADMSPYLAQMMRMQGRTPPPPWNIILQLREEYEVVPVAPETEAIDEDVDFLMVVHPKQLGEKMLFAVDQFVMKGGKLLVFIDPHCFVDQPPPNPSNPFARMQHNSSSSLNVLLRKWGVEMDPTLIAADLSLGINIRQPAGIIALSTYMGLNKKCVNPEEVITAKLHAVRVLFAGVLKKVRGAESTVTPLLLTTTTGNTWRPRGVFELQMIDAQAINRAVTPGSEPLMLACRISGKLETNFPDGITIRMEPEEGLDTEDNTDEKGEDDKDKEKTDAPKSRKLEAIQEAAPDATVLVFADVDMITDGLAYRRTFFGVTQVGDNASVVLNALEFLGGTGDLIAIRSRGRFDRPFEKVRQIEAEADKATAEETDSINIKIARFEETLDNLSARATDDNIDLIQSKALAERQKLQDEIRKARKELRALNTKKRLKIEELKASLQTHNMVWAPAAVLLIAVALAVLRGLRAKQYAAKRN